MNLAQAEKVVSEAAQNGARLAMLPECFNCPYGNKYFNQYSESLPDVGATEENCDSESIKALMRIAKKNNIYIVGGSIPEKGSDGKIYNTSISVSPEGIVLAKHQKMHLFDIDVPGKIRFIESETLSAGNQVTTFEMKDEGIKVGVGICYDIRFPELSLLMAKEGCQLLCFPGAFNMTTGPAHWELLGRSRALDNQLFLALCSPSRDESSSYHAWGHSTLFGPWGDVLATTGHEPDIVYGGVDLERLKQIRSSIPVQLQKREDVYQVTRK
eukprot:CAMPEP_0182451386 /NCGR_PEP_ID=MMETSP1172-20130603/43690_1 /TAXON_ID=708627 /ORGANISM="Timspurckia oligopyrenoides, Strain CCMP3278" /LENGTH=269 /DNA_ID=CAMNT_0024649157 /DNA_START=290 /DNA_END=1099 /DNA_ORIENTATION=-